MINQIPSMLHAPIFISICGILVISLGVLVEGFLIRRKRKKKMKREGKHITMILILTIASFCFFTISFFYLSLFCFFYSVLIALVLYFEKCFEKKQRSSSRIVFESTGFFESYVIVLLEEVPKNKVILKTSEVKDENGLFVSSSSSIEKSKGSTLKKTRFDQEPLTFFRRCIFELKLFTETKENIYNSDYLLFHLKRINSPIFNKIQK